MCNKRYVLLLQNRDKNAENKYLEKLKCNLYFIYTNYYIILQP